MSLLLHPLLHAGLLSVPAVSVQSELSLHVLLV
jgi:hypothetical protein